LAEKELEAWEILRRVRIEIMPYLRELRRHRRALIPRIEVTKRWIKYYEDLSKIRPLTPREAERLEELRSLLRMYEARRRLFREMARYARKPTPPQRSGLEIAKTAYYESKADYLQSIRRIEEAEKVREKLVPPPELYETWRRRLDEIGEKCKLYKEYKFVLTARAMLTPIERRVMLIRRYGEQLRVLYAKTAEELPKGKTLPELIEEYRAGME